MSDEVNFIDNYGNTMLILAAKENHVEKVRWLVEHGVDKEAKNNYNDTALITAAREGKMDTVKCLLELGVDKESKNDDGSTALISAACRDHVEVVQYLIELGADKEAKNRFGDTALIKAIREGKVKMVRCLLEQGVDTEAKNNHGSTALISATRLDLVDVVRLLLEHGANNEAKNFYGATPLINAVQVGNMDMVKCLFKHGADTEAKNKDGDTMLIAAAQKGHTNVVRYLIDLGADINATGNNSNTAAITAAWEGHLDVVRYLVEQGADKEFKGYIGNTALICSAERGHLEVVRYLVEQGANINYKRNDGKTALMLATSGKHLTVVGYLQYFVEQAASNNAQDIDGQTALVSAARYGQVDVVQKFVEQGVDSSRLDNQGNSALTHLLLSEYIVEEDNILATVKLLLEHGAPPLRSNNQGKSAKSIARKKNYIGVIDLLEEYKDKQPQPTAFRVDPEVENRNWFISVKTVSRMILPLAEGGFGKVFRAKWSHNDVVVKEIEIKTEAEMNRFRREVNLWRGLTHPNIVQLFGANDREPPYFMVSKYASNEILCKYLSSEKAQGRTVVWQKLFQVAAGLSYLHQQDIVHGDLKGNNIVVSNDGTAMLTDFGLSFLETASSYSVQKMKDMLGAMQWRAPEYAMMTVEKPTRKSDVYSLGMCIIEAVIGTTPWGVGFHSNVIREILRRNEVKLEKPEEMTDDQWVLVSRMIAYEPENRPDMNDVLSELERFAETEKRSEEARQVGNNAQSAHDSDVRENNGVGAVNVQSSGTHRTPAQTSTASANWSNREAASTSFEVPSRNSK